MILEKGGRHVSTRGWARGSRDLPEWFFDGQARAGCAIFEPNSKIALAFTQHFPQLESVAVYGKQATGEKYLINPNKG